MGKIWCEGTLLTAPSWLSSPSGRIGPPTQSGLFPSSPQESSGEPLACFAEESTWYLVGMASWGPGCKEHEAPPIYLRITSYQHWIWARINGQAVPAPSRALLVALPLPLSLLAAR